MLSQEQLMPHAARRSSNEELELADKDLGPLAWVLEELRKTIDSALKNTRRFHAEVQSAGVDVAAIDAAVLRTAKMQMHQAVGALEMVGITDAVVLLQSMEDAIQHYLQNPEDCSEHGVQVLERSSFALMEFLETVLAHRPTAAAALFPQYKEVQLLLGNDKVHPADLWKPLSVHAELKVPAAAHAVEPVNSLKAALEHNVLQLVKTGDAQAAARLCALSESMAVRSTAVQQRFWMVSAAFFEAWAHGLLATDLFTKRIASRVLMQFSAFERGDMSGSERLVHDMLFFCAQASHAQQLPAALQAVVTAFSLHSHAPVDYARPRFGRIDPSLLAQARKRIGNIAETWSALVGGDKAKLKLAVDQLGLVCESIHKLQPESNALVHALQRVAKQMEHSAQVPSTEVAMEVATAILYLQASFATLHLSDADTTEQAHVLATRLQSVLTGKASQPLASWMEELYRQASDAQTMGSVVGELRSKLDETEQVLDQYYRQQGNVSQLAPAVGHLSQMRGVLSVLGLDQASLAMLRMREVVEELLTGTCTQSEQQAKFERLSNSLGALGFLVDMLGYQRAMARKLFVYDEEKGELRPVMGRTPMVEKKASQQTIETPTSTDSMAEEEPLPQIHQVEMDLSSSGVATTSETNALDTPSLLPTADEDDSVMGSAVTVAERDGPSALRDGVPQGSFVLSQMDSAHPLLDIDASHSTLLESPSPEATALSSAHTEKAEKESTTAELPASEPLDSVSMEDGPEVDDELLDIFLEEAREVIATGREALHALQIQGGDMEAQTTLRRAFHTLKGSSRMVGLDSLGEAAWAFEQMMNAWLVEPKPMPQSMHGLSLQAMDAFAAWVDAIADGKAQAWEPTPFFASVEAMRQQGQWVPIHTPAIFKKISAEVADEALHVLSLAQDDFPVLEDRAGPLENEKQPEELVETENASGDFGIFEARSETEVSAQEALPDSLEMDTALDPHPVADMAEEIDFSAFEQAMESAEEQELLDRAEQPVEVEPAVENALEIDFDALSSQDFSWEKGDPDSLESATSSTTDTAFAAPLDDSELDTQACVSAEQTHIQDHELIHELAQEVPAPEEPLEVLAEQAVPVSDVAFETDGLAHPDSLGEVDALYEATLNLAEAPSQNIGNVQVPSPLLQVYLSEAQTWAQQLQMGLQDWLAIPHSMQPDALTVWAHGLAGSSSTVGYTALSELARQLEHTLLHIQPLGSNVGQQVIAACAAAGDEVVRLLEMFGQGQDGQASIAVLGGLQAVMALEVQVSTQMPLAQEAEALCRASASDDKPAETAQIPADAGSGMQTTSRSMGAAGSAAIDAVDVIDPDLFPIFEEEAVELLPALGSAMRQWAAQPRDQESCIVVLRALHTLKGSARLAGAMRLGEMAHRLESQLEPVDPETAASADIEPMLDQVDALQACFEHLRVVGAGGASEPIVVQTENSAAPSLQALQAMAQNAQAATGTADRPAPAPVVASRSQSQHTVRVRAQLLDRLINEAGEVLIARSRLDARMTVVHSALRDLSGNLEKLRQQLRDLEVQAESQMQSRMAYAKEEGGEFDPLEFDRFTRVQELTRMMAESVNDVATVQRILQREVTGAEDDLVGQGRQARELQRDLLRTRMVEFDSVSERLYAVVRNAAKETGKQVKLDIDGGTMEVDRGVLERMTPAFEHLLRNCVGHGIESPEVRTEAGKPAQGLITVQVQHDGNDVAVAFHDDGAGLNVERIRAKAIEQGLVKAEETVTPERAADLIFMPGFSTASSVTGLSGRGIGMDVVRSEVQSLGGRIETHSRSGHGSSFRMVLPLTTAVTQVVMIRAGNLSVGVPSNLVETVRRVTVDELDAAYRTGYLPDGDMNVPFYWAGAVWQQSSRSSDDAVGRTRPVVMLRSAAQRIALHVDEMLGTQEVVVKHLGPQMARLPGLTGMSVLPSGAVVLIYNPVALTTVYAERIRARGEVEADNTGVAVAQAAGSSQVPLVMVVDDSITVRRVTQRLLHREGYRVLQAADGQQALEKLEGELPCMVLSDIEMPRMDGFDLVRNIRADERLQHLPIVMITSRTADKHRELAMSLGANHYLGKPYRDDELMRLVHRYAEQVEASAVAPGMGAPR